MKKWLLASLVLFLLAGSPIYLLWRKLSPGKFLHTSKAIELQTRFRSGIELSRLYQLDRALKEFETCLEIDPNHGRAHFQRGRILLALGRVEEAMAGFRSALSLSRSDTAIHRFLFEFYLDSKPPQIAKAKEHYGALKGICGELSDFDIKLGDEVAKGETNEGYQIAAGKLRGKRGSLPGQLGELYEAFFPGGNEDPGVQGILGYQKFQQLFERYPGLTCLRESLALQLSNPSRLGLPPAEDGRIPGSTIPLELCQHILEDLLDHSVLHSSVSIDRISMLALLSMKMGDYSEATSRFRWVLERENLLPRVRLHNSFYLGVCHYKTGNLDAAREVFREILRKNPSHTPSHWFYFLLGEMELPLRQVVIPSDLKAGFEFREIAEELGVAKYDAGGSSAWADYDGDGDLDLFASGCDTYSILYRNEGGRFADNSAEAGLRDVQSGFSNLFVDFNSDGNPDLFVGRDGWAGPGPNSLYQNQGNGTFIDVTRRSNLNQGPEASTFTSAWADFDRDGDLDLLLANNVSGEGSRNRLLRNNGNGVFSDATEAAGLLEPQGIRTIGCAVGDYDLDGWPDIFFTGLETAPNRLYHNRGNGTFEEVAKEAGVDDRANIAMGFVALFSDLDGDGWQDIFMVKWEPDFEKVKRAMMRSYQPDPASLRSAPRYFRNRRDGTFEDRTEIAGFIYPHGGMAAGIADVNNDGFQDVYVGTGGPAIERLEPDGFYVNLDGNHFVNAARLVGLGQHGKGHGIAFADFDRDGDLDFYVPVGAAFHGDFWKNLFYINLAGNRLNWLQVLLVGTKSNAMAVGAQVTARAGDLIVFREKKCGTGFGACDSPYLHFGLGKQAKVDTLTVRWPSGFVETFGDVPVNCHLRIREGDRKWEKEKS